MTRKKVKVLRLQEDYKTEFDVPTSNAWDFPISLREYLNKYTYIHILDHDIREKNLKENPVSSSVNIPKILDNYMKELLIKIKQNTDINSSKFHRGSTRKSLPVLRPLSHLWLKMENEKLSLTESGDEEIQEMTAISSLFEQTMLLIGQISHSIS